MRLGNLTRVADSLGLTPSAISHALGRLREVFDDPLFERRAQGVVPTPRARSLSPQISHALNALRGAIGDGREFRPESIDRVFQVSALDGPIATLAPALLEKLARRAPKARVAFRSLGRDEGRRAVAEGRIDLAIGVFDAPLTSERLHELGKERFVVVARRGHPGIGSELTLETWLAFDHVLVSAAGDLVGAVDVALAEQGRSRRVRASLPQFLTAFATVARSDATATVGEGQARSYGELFNLDIFEVPIPMAPFRLQMLSTRGAPDPALDWLMEEMSSVYAAQR